MTNRKLLRICLNDSAEKLEREHSMLACRRQHCCGQHSGCPLAPEAFCVL